MILAAGGLVRFNNGMWAGSGQRCGSLGFQASIFHHTPAPRVSRATHVTSGHQPRGKFQRPEKESRRVALPPDPDVMTQQQPAS